MIRIQSATRTITTGSAADRNKLREQLAADPAAEATLGELATSVNPIVRDWVAWAAPQLLNRLAAISLLGRLADDRDVDVRSEARRYLVQLDEAWARRFVPTYLKALLSDDVPEATDAIWQLVKLRELSAVAPIEQLASAAEHPLVRNTARVAALVLTGQDDQLIDALAAHDHEHAALWMRGLLYAGTGPSLAALRAYAAGAPDEQCRRRAAQILTKVDQVKPIPIR